MALHRVIPRNLSIFSEHVKELVILNKSVSSAVVVSFSDQDTQQHLVPKPGKTGLGLSKIVSTVK